MKVTFAVLFAVVAVASGSVLPLSWGVRDLSGAGLGLHGVGLSGLGWSGHGLSSVAVSPISPWAVSSGIVRHAPAAVDISPVATALHAPLVAAPLVATPIVAAPVHHEAVSVTANRGSVHVAPLPGHAVSSSQLNLSPAPGTW